jgi:hypothetical protein
MLFVMISHAKVPWDAVAFFDHPDDQVSCFNNLFLDVLEQHAYAPVKTFKSKYHKSKVKTPEIRSGAAEHFFFWGGAKFKKLTIVFD